MASLFLQNVIAIIWDFDETLIKGHMQKPIFDRYSVDGTKFWREVNALPATYQKQGIMVSKDTLYLNHILTYVRRGHFAGLNNAALKQMGQELKFFPGLPDFFPAIKATIQEREEFKGHQILVEHYIVSTGLRQMIMGSLIAPHVTDIWGCEFIEEPAGPGYLPGLRSMELVPAQGRRRKKTENGQEAIIQQVGYAIDNTTKTRAIFEINKGTNTDPKIDVNATIREEDRRVPFQNMIYIADGPSDIPVFSVLNRFGGKTYAVYPAGSQDHFAQVYDLERNRRVQGFGEADYRPNSQTYMWIRHSAEEIARRIVRDRAQALRDRVSGPPGHITELLVKADLAEQLSTAEIPMSADATEGE